LANQAEEREMSNTQSAPTLVDNEQSRGQHFDEAEELVRQVMRFALLMKRATSRFVSQQSDGIEQAAYFLLGVLATNGPQRTTALAEAVHSDTSTVSRQVGALVRHGLVERQADPADGRACLLAATAEGQRCFEHQRTARTQQIADVLGHWSPDELHAVAESLGRLNGEFERHEHEHHTGATSASHLKGGTR
jgi:DNA-binding MarR family transcriptional regulator